MLIANKNSRVLCATALSLFLIGCESNKNFVEKEIEKEQIVNETVKDDSNKAASTLREELSIGKSLEELTEEELQLLYKDGYDFTDEQLEKFALGESQTAAEAIDVQNSNLQKGVEVTLLSNIEDKPFTNQDEAAQYLSYLFFQMHTQLINSETFYKGIKQHMSDDFIELIPNSDKDRIALFESIQRIFSEQLEFKIEKYAMTKVTHNSLANEGVFFRKYTLFNGEEIYYQTTMLKDEKGIWKLKDDEPGVGYTTDSAYEETFIE